MIRVPLNNRSGKPLFALIDDEDGPLVLQYHWHAAPGGNRTYARRKWRDATGKQLQQSMHQLISGVNGIDHEDRNGLNNQRSNLRRATAAQQVQNRTKASGRWMSDYKGVCWSSRTSNWVADIRHQGRLRRLGYFEDEVDAARMYDAAAAVLFGEFAVLNFPNEVPSPWSDRPPRVKSSQYRGVSLVKSTNRWQAYIIINGKQRSLGVSFTVEADAAHAYDAAAREAFGSRALLNFPGALWVSLSFTRSVPMARDATTWVPSGTYSA